MTATVIPARLSVTLTLSFSLKVPISPVVLASSIHSPSESPLHFSSVPPLQQLVSRLTPRNHLPCPLSSTAPWLTLSFLAVGHLSKAASALPTCPQLPAPLIITNANPDFGVRLLPVLGHLTLLGPASPSMQWNCFSGCGEG